MASARKYDWFRTCRDDANGVEALQAALLRHCYSRHAHETYSIGVAEEGSQTFWHRGALHRTRPGSVIAFNPFDLHDGHATTQTGVVYRMLYLDPGPVEEAAAEQGARGALGFTAPLSADRALAQAILAYAKSLDAGDEPLAIAEHYHTLVAHLVRLTRRRWPGAGGESERALARVREEIRENMAEAVTIGRLAATAGLGRFRLIRAFRRRFGLPPSAYLRTVRLEAAKRLLMEGEAPAAVAAATGFADQSHLTRRFKQAYGVTPGAYREAMRQGG